MSNQHHVCLWLQTSTLLPYIVSMPKPSSSKRARVLSSRVVFRGPVFSVTTDKVMEPSGITARRDVIRHPGSVVILAVDDSYKEPRVLLEWQYRHAARGFLWELPAGRIDEGETELAAAKRELIEETGFTSQRWQRAFKYFASPGFMDETMAVYLAGAIRPGKAQPEEDESIRTRLFSVSDAVRKIQRGTIRDGKTIAGVLWLQHHLQSR
jgi:ADP-ribose pyrophosphatase